MQCKMAVEDITQLGVLLRLVQFRLPTLPILLPAIQLEKATNTDFAVNHQNLLLAGHHQGATQELVRPCRLAFLQES